jgi:uncharacterized protein (UPF0332 family)
MKQEGIALIDYRIKQARESIQEAKVLWGQGMSNRSVMNRLYYAMFYAVLALLQEKRWVHRNIMAQYPYSTVNL